GSNIDPERNLRKAAHLLREQWPRIRFSRVYETAPRDKQDQPPFLNAVAVFDSDEPPEDIHRILQAIEQTLGKHVTERFGPRTIDLDLLLYGDAVIDTPTLQVPHPRMHERRFVLEPLRELLSADLPHPTLRQSWRELSTAVAQQQCARIDDCTL
ncbi:MAG: 2-amino-4-hydroxy-6-hydroxymethyldihydropteridine diphosphokinase, partial [Candidatus Peregrinibacteria bacterium Greene0416_19]